MVTIPFQLGYQICFMEYSLNINEDRPSTKTQMGIGYIGFVYDS